MLFRKLSKSSMASSQIIVTNSIGISSHPGTFPFGILRIPFLISSCIIGGPVRSSRKAIGASCPVSSAYSSLMYSHHLPIISSSSTIRLPCFDFMHPVHIMTVALCFPVVSLMRPCVSFGLDPCVLSISSHFSLKYFSVAALHMLLIYRWSTWYLSLPFAFLLSSIFCWISVVIHRTCVHLGFSGMYLFLISVRTSLYWPHAYCTPVTRSIDFKEWLASFLSLFLRSEFRFS